MVIHFTIESLIWNNTLVITAKKTSVIKENRESITCNEIQKNPKKYSLRVFFGFFCRPI